MLFLWFYNKFWGEKKRDSEISIFRVKKEHKIQKSDIISLQTKNTKDFKLMPEFQFIKNALGLQEKDHIICENDEKILKLVVSSDTSEQTCPKCGLKTTRIRDYRTQTIKTILSGYEI